MRMLFVVAALLAATPALAQDEEPHFCPNRPDLGASGCTTTPGSVQFEISGVDWERDDSADARSDTVTAGDFQARFGIGPRTEVSVSWTPLGQVRTRDRATGRVTRDRGVGDVTLAVRQSLAGADGEGFTLGLEPSVTLPTGGKAIGAGDWGAGLLIPVTYDLSDKWSVGLTSEVDAAVDQDRDGRHFYASTVLGLGYAISEQVGITSELFVARDHDPAGRQTHFLFAQSIAWQPKRGFQLDALAAVGLNRVTPDFRLLTGGAFLF